MPVITRSQYKKLVSTKQDIVPSDLSFKTDCQVLMGRLQSTIGKENKMRVALEIFEKVNKELPQLISTRSQETSWIKFSAVIFNKINQFNDEYSSGEWQEIDENLVDKFIEELCKARKIVLEIIENYMGPCFSDHIIKAKDEIERLLRVGLLRRITRVNYTGMAVTTLEYESEDDEDDKDYVE